MNGAGATPAGVGVAYSGGGPTRCSSWLGSAGTPHKVSDTACSGMNVERSSIVAVRP